MKIRGVVLLTTLVMILVMAQLVLSLMQSNVVFLKASHQLSHGHDSFYKLESAAYRLSASNLLLLPVNCRIVVTPPNKIITRLQHGGCQFIYRDRIYYYLLEDMGIYSKLPMLVDYKLFASHHWLLTMLGGDSRHFALQLRVVTPDVEVTQVLIKPITSRVVSWRVLSDDD